MMFAEIILIITRAHKFNKSQGNRFVLNKCDKIIKLVIIVSFEQDSVDFDGFKPCLVTGI